jgi:hypothetical protein
MNEEFKRLKRWVEECPVEAAMRIDEVEDRLEVLNKRYALMKEKATIQEKVMKFVNKVMFEESKRQKSLPSEEQNRDLLYITWSTNDIIADNPRIKEIDEELEYLY